MADSKSFVGGMVLSIISCWLGASIQLSLLAINAPVPSCNSRVGSASTPARGSEGPIARTITFFGCVPVMIKPPIKTLSPVSTRRRVEILAKVVATGVADGEGVGVESEWV